MTLTQEQVIAAVTKLTSDLEQYYAKAATFLVCGFVSGFLLGVAVALVMSH